MTTPPPTIRKIGDEICEALNPAPLTSEEFMAYMQTNFGYTATDVDEAVQSIAKSACNQLQRQQAGILQSIANPQTPNSTL